MNAQFSKTKLTDVASVGISNIKVAVIGLGYVGLPVALKFASEFRNTVNNQRDLNIALMNEVALTCVRIFIRTLDLLEAAGTQWNFLPFRPGLVVGHCIGINLYYLTTRAEELGYYPEVVLAGQRINDNMGPYLGLTFKENVSDVRNSRVPNIAKELQQYLDMDVYSFTS
jgi:UDP-N-acetyl-D-glucosamine/UDP-N-acetyl-D-galactosamine dehydrogenase